MKEILQKLLLETEKQSKLSETANKRRAMTDKEMTEQFKKIAKGDFLKPLSEGNAAVLDRARDAKVHNTLAGNIGGAVMGGVKNVGSFFTPRGFLDKTGIVKKGSGGIIDQMFEARKARTDRIKARVMAGEVPEEKGIFAKIKQGIQLSGEAKREQAQRRELAKLDEQEQFMRDNGIDEQTIAQSDVREKKNSLAEQMKVTGFGAKEEDDEKADSNVVTEEEREQLKIQEDQSDKLDDIAENTKDMAAALSGKGSGSSKPEESGGMFSGIGGALSGLGKGVGGLAKGLGSGIGKGLIGLSTGLMALANPAALLGLGAVTLAVMGIAKALEIAAPAIKEFVPVMKEMVSTIGEVFIEGIKAIPEIISSVADAIVNLIGGIKDIIVGVMDKIVESVERLGKVDGTNLLAVGGGLFAVAAGLGAFATGSVVKGVTDTLGSLFNAVSGRKSTVEQLEDIAKLGPDLEKAGTGMEKLARGLGGFSDVESEKVEQDVVVAKAKVTNISKGKMSPVTSYTKNGRTYKLTDEERMALSNADLSGQEIVTGPNGEQRLVLKDGDKLTAANGAIKDAERQAMREMMGGNTNINAPTTTVNNSTSNNVVKAPVRNVDTSVNAYYRGNWIMESNASSF